jgi:type VI secretion system protein ImpF
MENIGKFERARATMVNYGLSDITALGLSSASDQKRLRKALEQCLREFEPRLTDVVVTFEESQTADRRLRFHVQGLMRINPAPEEISFDTVLELSSGEYTVK